MKRNFICILSSYSCNKKCPFCIARMSNLSETNENIDKLEEILNKNKYKYEYFILSGNGEPSLYDFSDLKNISEILKKFNNKFLEKRIQTSGNLFFETKKLELFENWIIEITRISKDSVIDMNYLNYSKDYLNAENFLNKRIRLNQILLKDNYDEIVDTIKYYFKKYNNIEQIALKILDNKNNDSIQSNWIKQYGLTYDILPELIELMNSNFIFTNKTENNFFWDYEGKKISLFYKNKNFKDNNHIFYENGLII